ncbi:MAG: CopD family protein [Proteobacteria bacterium]|nr:CopD family protein [Pseudomonadota bacterium]
MKSVRPLLLLLLLLPAGLLLGSATARATADFSAQTRLSCLYCHEDPRGRGTLTIEGEAFRGAGWRLPEGARPSAWPRVIRLAIGFLHVLFSIVWLGAIFYVHLFMGPRSLTGGLPKSEVRLGRASLLLVGLTGLVLTWLRLPAWTALWTTTFGIVLMVKVGLFLGMVVIAAVTTTRIDRMLRESSQPDRTPPSATSITYEGQTYDVSGSRLWKDGVHMRRHRTGVDLTEALASAPHGPEVLDRLPCLGPFSEPEPERTPAAMRLFVSLAYTALVFAVLIVFCVAYWKWGPPFTHSEALRWQAEKNIACLECHRQATPGIYLDWSRSLHARLRVGCLHCHQAGENDPDVSRTHERQYQRTDHPYGTPRYQTPVAATVSPRDCARCHPGPVEEFSRSKHAGTLDIIRRIDPWLRDGMNSPIERASGCFACHGSLPSAENGRLKRGSDSNVGIGRVNRDGGPGSCTSCHTRHRFSIAEARKPEACGQCHLGPDHPQIEIYNESKHGGIYAATGTQWVWDPPPAHWRAGRDYRTPTCAVCHMSATAGFPASHDVSARLAWELQAPLTIRPSEFEAWPRAGDWRVERARMKTVCLQCHGPTWVEAHFQRLDRVVVEYNDVYFRPARAVLESLYQSGLLDKTRYFDERLEVEFYELWHHEGRRARMGAAMMAPDYVWWHGFYECKKRFTDFMHQAEELERLKVKAYRASDFPGTDPKGGLRMDGGPGSVR